MLKLCNIKKSYKTGDFVQHALNGVSAEFSRGEFVAVLGPSGSGKTTLLNIVGGLDRYDSGDLILNGRSTKDFSQTEWDAYRNNCIGFIFQSYNLIGHLSVLENVELGMVLSGTGMRERRRRAVEALKKLGISDHIGKKPGQLSGGQMQRVAIARAIAPEPDIILADEPTGALDSATSEQIMEIIKELAKDKLVIMVTHNAELAKRYADRILEFRDGMLVSDSGVSHSLSDGGGLKLRRTSMSFFTALRLALKNIFTKKLKTALTSVAASIGIIGISLILALSNGFGLQIDGYQAKALGSYPIIISKTAFSVDPADFAEMENGGLPKYPDVTVAYPFDSSESSIIHYNRITSEFIEYVDAADRSSVRGIAYGRGMQLNLLVKSGDSVRKINSSELSISLLPLEYGQVNGFLTDDYDVLAFSGSALSESISDVFIVVDSRNRIDAETAALLGLDASVEEIPLADMLGIEIRFIPNDAWYIENDGIFSVNSDLASVYDDESAVSLRVAGVVRPKEASRLTAASAGLLMRSEMTEEAVRINSDSAIVAAQRTSANDVRTGLPFSDGIAGETLRETVLAQLGDSVMPNQIYIYPVNFDSKDAVTAYLDDYNTDKSDEDKIVYTDMAETISNLTSNILNGVTVVLVVFSSVSLVVSSIMIGIITYSSVIERTREIGILRALGARKKDVSRVFNAETFIIGICSGIIGIGLSLLAMIPANAILFSLTELENVAVMNPLHTLVLVTVCVLTSLIGGLIPASIASRKDPVAALRSE